MILLHMSNFFMMKITRKSLKWSKTRCINRTTSMETEKCEATSICGMSSVQWSAIGNIRQLVATTFTTDDLVLLNGFTFSSIYRYFDGKFIVPDDMVVEVTIVEFSRTEEERILWMAREMFSGGKVNVIKPTLKYVIRLRLKSLKDHRLCTVSLMKSKERFHFITSRNWRQTPIL